MGNQIELAIKKAGMKIPPLNKRIWLWLKDHPCKTAREISVALGAPFGQVSTRLVKMKDRKMVDGRSDHARKPVRGRYVLEYIALGTEYALAPTSSLRPTTPTVHPGKCKCGPVTDVTHTTVHLTTVRVPDMPLAKAFALYQELKGYFAS